MVMEGLRELCTKVTGAANLANAKSGKGINSKADPSTLCIVFMAFLSAVLPLDISQLGFAILGAVLYALLQKSDQTTPKKKKSISMVVETSPHNATLQAPKVKARPIHTVGATGSHVKAVSSPLMQPEIRSPSAQPIAAPTFHSDGWEGEIRELLLQITPTSEAEQIVDQLAQMIRQIMQSTIPEIEVNGFASGNLTFGKAFGVAVPEVDIIASISPQVMFSRLHGRSTQCSTSQLDAKKLQKSAIRACTDRLVSVGGFKFRRSAFRGHEPKVTLLAPASLGLFSDSIPIDFSVNVVTPLYNAALLTECGRMDSRAKELILLVKRWAKDRGISHAAKGHLSPYMWGLLSIYFLQAGVRDEGPLLPPLQHFEIAPGLLDDKKSTVNTSKQPKWKAVETTEAKKSAGTLFKEFVHFFETQFDWRNEAVSIRTGQRAPPSLELPLHIIVSDDTTTSQVGLSIEDPFYKAQNLGDGMTAASLMRLKEELSRAEALCCRSASLSELLEPWVPAETAEHRDDDVQVDRRVVSSPMSADKKLPEVTTKGEDWRRDAIEAQASAMPPWRRPGALAAARTTSSPTTQAQ